MNIWKLAFVFLMLVGSIIPVSCEELKYEVVRDTLHSPEELIGCWKGAERLSRKLAKLSPADILNLYQYEKCGFRSMNGAIKDLEEHAVHLSAWGVLGLNYLKAHPERYREIVHAEFDTSVERFPSRALLELIARKAPDSPERWTIEWDLDYSDFIRQFTYVHKGNSKGKTCAKYYEDYVKSHRELQENYTKNEIEGIVKDCEGDRERYRTGLKELFDKFKGKPVTPKVYDPDETNIVSDEYFGIS